MNPHPASEDPRAVLILHGNGGSRTRFRLLLERLPALAPGLLPVIPELSGFDGRPLPAVPNLWDVFLHEIAGAADAAGAAQRWTWYGHGIGGSVLMELAARDFVFPDGIQRRPDRIILHGAIGAGMERRWFPGLMRPRAVRSIIQQLVASPLLRPLWVRRLFRHPERIPAQVLNQFFEDYGQCASFSAWFDLITPAWYRRVQAAAREVPFHLLWGAQERVVTAQHLPLWQADFPRASIEVVPGWDHFPMLDEADVFAAKFVSLMR
ncbi:MAG: alpha/beta hydrolase [Bacteroidia bacterium]|nr:alpha/beta hydrolase [Bacteroidia bacterium]